MPVFEADFLGTNNSAADENSDNEENDDSDDFDSGGVSVD